jgi:translation initiation factor IF-1
MDMIVTAYMSGKMKKNKIKILPSDRVRVALSEYDPSK